MKQIVLGRQAKKDLKKLPKFVQIAVARKLRLMRDGEQIEGVLTEKLKGYKDIFRIRLGNYRLVYRLTKDEVFVVCILHRREVYERVKRLLS